MAEAPTPPTKAPKATPKAEWPLFMQHLVFPFLHNPSLRPVLIAILGHVACAWALALLRVWDTVRLEDFAILFLLVASSLFPVFEELRIDRRLGAVTATVAVSWVMGVLFAVGLRWAGAL